MFSTKTLCGHFQVPKFVDRRIILMSVTAVLKLQRQRFVLLCVFQFLFLVLSGEAAAVWIVLYTLKTKHMVAKTIFL